VSHHWRKGLDIRGLSIVFRCRTESANAIAQDHCQAWEAYGPSIRFQSTEVVFLLTLITSRAAFYSRNLRNWRNARGTGVRPCPAVLFQLMVMVTGVEWLSEPDVPVTINVT